MITVKQIISNMTFMSSICHTDLTNAGSHSNVATNPEFIRGANEIRYFIAFS
jgi:hypothetical protein